MLLENSITRSKRGNKMNQLKEEFVDIIKTIREILKTDECVECSCLYISYRIIKQKEVV